MWKYIVGALAAIAAVLFGGRWKKGQDAQDRVEGVDAHAEREKAKAERLYQERLARAKRDAAASVADRPDTDDPVADLRSRLDR